MTRPEAAWEGLAEGILKGGIGPRIAKNDKIVIFRALQTGRKMMIKQQPEPGNSASGRAIQ